MPQQKKVFRVFVSSTFSDMREERSLLQTEVFPKLEDLCNENGAKFQAVDLRWGVNEESQLNHKTIEICLNEINRCQRISPKPNYIVLLGDRYGWQPVPAVIPSREMVRLLGSLQKKSDDKAFLEKWYREDKNAIPGEYVLQPVKAGPASAPAENFKAVEARLRDILRGAVDALGFTEQERTKYFTSATHQEIILGALNPPEGAKKPEEHVFAYARKINGLPYDETAEDYIELQDNKQDPFCEAQLKSLKAALEAKLGDGYHKYEAEWKNGKSKITDEAAFAQRVLDDLTGIIKSELEKIGTGGSLEHEKKLQEEFCKKLDEHFYGREDIIAEIGDYLEDGSDNNILALTGKPGSGKSSIVAHLIGNAAKKSDIAYRFIGITAQSSNTVSLLRSICEQTAKQFGTDLNAVAGENIGEAPNQLLALRDAFGKCLKLALADKPVIIFLDGLDRLPGSAEPSSFDWLPPELPPYVKIIATLLPESKDRLPNARVLEIRDLSTGDAEMILDMWSASLTPRPRILQRFQKDEIIAGFKAEGLPIYLRLAFEKAKYWHHYDQGDAIRLPAGISGMIKEFFDMLEKQHTRELVSNVACYMMSGKYQGLTEKEILSLLPDDGGFWDYFVNTYTHESLREEIAKSKKIPMVVWSRLYLDLEAYLTEKDENGESLITFFYSGFSDYVRQAYLKNTQETAYHKNLAAHFKKQPLYFSGSNARKTLNQRRMSELLYQFANTGLWDDIEEAVCDVEFVEAKCAYAEIQDFIYEIAEIDKLRASPSLMQVRQALINSIHCCNTRPELIAQSVYNRLKFTDIPGPRLQEALRRARAKLDAWEGWIEAEAPLPGSKTGESAVTEFKNPARLQHLFTNFLAVDALDGHITVFDVLTGKIIREIGLGGEKVRLLAVNKNCDIAFMDKAGRIRSGRYKHIFEGRWSDSGMCFYNEHCLIAAGGDNVLTAWDPKTGKSAAIVSGLPSPLKLVKAYPDFGKVLFVAGPNNEMAGISEEKDGIWQTSLLDFLRGKPYVSVDLDCRMNLILAVSKDRRVLAVDAESGAVANQVFYEAQKDLVLRGAPVKCAWGKGPAHGKAFFATLSGQIASWDTKSGSLELMEDYCTVSDLKYIVCFDTVEPGGMLYVSVEEWCKEISGRSGRRTPAWPAATVNRCLAAPDGTILALYENKSLIRWLDGKSLELLDERSQLYPRSADFLGAGGAAAVGSAPGLVWTQPMNVDVRPEDMLFRFSNPVSSLFADQRDNSVIAADTSGKVVRLDPVNGQIEILRYSNCYEEWIGIVPAKEYGLLWSLRKVEENGDRYHVISLLDTNKNETDVFKTADIISDIAVSGRAALVAAAGPSLKVFRYEGGRLAETGSVPKKCGHVLFLGNGAYIAVSLNSEEYIEIFKTGEVLTPVAAIDCKSGVTSLSSYGDHIAAGLLSGEIMSLRFNCSN